MPRPDARHQGIGDRLSAGPLDRQCGDQGASDAFCFSDVGECAADHAAAELVTGASHEVLGDAGLADPARPGEGDQ